MEQSDYISKYMENTALSKQLFERAQVLMPGGVSHDYRYFPPHPFFINRAEGSKIRDVDGNEYIDLWMGHSAMILGYNSPVVKEALNEVADIGIHWGILHEYELSFAELIKESVPCAEKILFATSGTEATMHAVRLARAFTKKGTILKVSGGWHGGNSELSWAIRQPFEEPESAGILPCYGKYVRAIPFNDTKETLKILSAINEDLAGVIIEPVVGAGGFIPAEKEYLEMLRDETQRRNSLLIFDEIVTGFRLGLGGAQEVYGVVPDLVTLGKVVGGGTNIGVIAGKGEIMSLCAPTIQRKKGEGVMAGGGTFSCSPLSMIVGCRVGTYLKKNVKAVYPKINQLGTKLRLGMKKALESKGGYVQTPGIGSLCGLCFPLDPNTTTIKSPSRMQELTNMKKVNHEFRIRMINHGVFITFGGGAISFAHTEEDIDQIIAATTEVAEEMSYDFINSKM